MLPVVAGAVCLVWTLTATPRAAQQADPGPERFAGEIETFIEWDTKNAVPADGVLFVGSSTIRLWPTADRFPGLPVINRGFGGSRIPDVLHYLDDAVLEYRPSVVVFYAGDNDINSGRTPAQVAADYRTFVERVAATRADTQFIFLPIKPSIARWAIWPAMREANDLVREYSDTDPRLHYADVATPMLTAEGQTQPHLYVEDGLHMSEAGYDLWTSVLAPVIARARTAR